MTVPVLPTQYDPAELELASRTIAHWRGDDCSLNLVSGQLGTFSRGATASQVDTNASSFTAANAMPLWEPRDWLAGGSRTHMGLLMGTSDRLHFAASWVPRSFAFYVELIEVSARTGSGTIFSVSNDANTGARVALAGNGTNYALTHHNGTTSVTATMAGAQPVPGDRVVLYGQVYDDGSVQLWQQVNAGAVQATARSAANTLASAWAATARLRLNAQGTATNPGASWFKRLKLVPGLPDSTTLSRLF